MKKILYSVAVAALMFAGCSKDDEKTTPTVAGPQVPVAKTNKALTQKFTGTKCPPCGGWGWSMAQELEAYGAGKALFLATFSQNFVAEGFITTAASDMDVKWNVGSFGYPCFAVNGATKTSRPSGSVNTTAEKQMCKDAIDAHSAATVVASTGVKMSISGSTLKVTASTQFFQSGSGDYNVAFYMVENGAMWAQSGHPSSNGVTPIAHEGVLRGAMNGTWGETKFTGNVKANDFKDMSYSYTMPSTWVAADMNVYAVIWKKNSSGGYDFVNASSAK